MSGNIEISLGAGKSYLLETAGKICDKNIIVRNESYDAFWDSYQQYGTKIDYQNAFSGIGWDDNLFKPKYDMQPTAANNMFHNTAITDLPAALERAGVSLDLSKSTAAQQLFLGAKTKHIGVLDLSNSGYCNYLFNAATNLETVDELILSEKLKMIASAFDSCTALKNIKFSGVIPVSISLAQCSQLTNASVQSIIDCLKDLRGATAQTLTLHATVGGNMTAEQKAAITAKNWQLVY